MPQKYDVEYIAGGATQNSMRVCQWVVGVPNAVSYMGCIGNDQFGRILEQKARAVGLNTVYQRHPTEKTGTCASCITGNHR
jgi:adenosine kinase